MLETEAAWLAGIIDGEGCISLFRRSTYYVPAVKISNTNEKLINKCKQILDDADIQYCVRYSDRGERKNAKPAWELTLESRPRVIAVLNLVLPYLVAKTEQAELVLDWCSEGKRSPEATKADYIDNIRVLNQRGRVK